MFDHFVGLALKGLSYLVNANGRGSDALILDFESCFFPFKPSVAFHIETNYFFLQSKTNDWFLHETQHWAEMG